MLLLKRLVMPRLITNSNANYIAFCHRSYQATGGRFTEVHRISTSNNLFLDMAKNKITLVLVSLRGNN